MILLASFAPTVPVLRLSEDTGGHLVFPDRRLVFVCTKREVGGAARRAQDPEKIERKRERD
ncbi:hypothetical protein EYF80_041291 [Liparis tanakae]|uniref:Uncharacterized protein n=1 Tax=Liparis tanakae TaxID=230148 RepID=A0A4Z2G6H9_9TELE|nr:hypothetical protein EYF80_041291 [Liparis tanakae]